MGGSMPLGAKMGPSGSGEAKGRGEKGEGGLNEGRQCDM